ncbi:PaaI family thioesterase [Actinomycetospora straminea]|uniref:Acyl-coenzyme A thioesterase PaaI-like protein n=1 Tax=Actinomycetospora straminea TaxID=663607 RepID=A0ABP9EIP2_9PSEU|nr:hypothetical protein [Actinomycetospora straminea]MDD7936409.1 hypothetical protein [Actinomycetospora straminea]
MHAAVGARLRAVAPGRAEAVLPVLPALPAPAREPDAALWVLADFVTGVAVTGTLAPGERITTLRLTLHVVARTSGSLRGVGTLDDVTDGVALSTAVITDDAGRTVARAIGRNAVLADGVAASTWPGAASTWSDPPRAPDGLVLEGAAPDPVAVNHAGVVQGGALASLPARALADVLGGPADEATATFLRAVPVDGRTVHTTTEVEHGGRRLRSARAVLRDDRDRTVLTMTGLRYSGS